MKTVQQLEKEIIEHLTTHDSYENDGFVIKYKRSPGVMKVELINLATDSVLHEEPVYRLMSVVSTMIYFIQTKNLKH